MGALAVCPTTASDGHCSLAQLPLRQARQQDLGILGSQPRSWRSDPVHLVWGVCIGWQSPRGCGRCGHRHRINTALREPCEDSCWPFPLPTALVGPCHMHVCERQKRHGVRNTPTQAQVQWIGRARGNISSLMTWGVGVPPADPSFTPSGLAPTPIPEHFPPSPPDDGEASGSLPKVPQAGANGGSLSMVTGKAMEPPPARRHRLMLLGRPVGWLLRDLLPGDNVGLGRLSP